MVRTFWKVAISFAAFALFLQPAAARKCTKAEATSADAGLVAFSNDPAKVRASIAESFPWGMPTSSGAPTAKQDVLAQEAYVVQYDEALRIPVWSGEAIGVFQVDPSVVRIDCFRADPRIAEDAASTPDDYEEPIFDQGHMTPAADQKYSDDTMIDTTLMSNMTPQYCRFNRGTWEMLEEIVRFWSEKHDVLYVLTGSVFETTPIKRMASNNGDTRVAIPSHIYKLLAYKTDDGGVATLIIMLPNTNKEIAKAREVAFLKSNVVSIADLQAATGLTFFPNLTKPIHETTAADFWDTTGAKFSPLTSRCP